MKFESFLNTIYVIYLGISIKHEGKKFSSRNVMVRNSRSHCDTISEPVSSTLLFYHRPFLFLNSILIPMLLMKTHGRNINTNLQYMDP